MCERYQDKHLPYFNGHGMSRSVTPYRFPTTAGPRVARQTGEQNQFGVLDNMSMNKFIKNGVPNQDKSNRGVFMNSLESFKN